MQIPLAEPQAQQGQMFPCNSLIAWCRSTPVEAGAAIEFGRFRILMRRRELLADGLPANLGTRAFDILMVLIEAEGSLVTKEELMEGVWPGIVVAPENLKVQIAKLRSALAEDRDLIRTEFGRGYRFTGIVRRTTVAVPKHLPARGEGDPGIGLAAASLMDFTGIASRLAALEAKLAESLEIFAGRPHRIPDEPHLDIHCAGRAPRRRRSRRRGNFATTASGAPRRMTDWVTGG
jgi:DNA-binding winged helix-turn-helix (wHTH) protein